MTPEAIRIVKERARWKREFFTTINSKSLEGMQLFKVVHKAIWRAERDGLIMALHIINEIGKRADCAEGCERCGDAITETIAKLDILHGIGIDGRKSDAKKD